MNLGPNDPGDILILLAFAFNLVSGLAWLASARGRSEFDSLARRSWYALTAVVALASACLFYLFFSHNYAIKYVYQYSDSSLSFFYLLSAFWGGQEGTYLLWVLLNVLCGYVLIHRAGRLREWAMAVFALVNAFFLFILIQLSPFELLPFPAQEGAGLNPLLQDPWMVIHPPVIFIGYAMAAVPFALVMAALIRKDYSEWLRRAFPWVAVTAVMLAAGNIMGGYWAYKTLGWGGYWAWDPVENSSLVPWLVSLGLLHGLIVQRRNGGLQKSNILLTAFVFVLVIYGTFLTRSGVLADFSVHSFVNLGQNIYLIVFLAAMVTLSLTAFLVRARSVPLVPLNYSFWGREFMLVAATVLLFIFGMIVLFWSSLPVLTSVFTDQPRAADIGTYNDFALPMAIIYALLLGITPITNFSIHNMKSWPLKLTAMIAAATVLAFMLFDLALGAGLTFDILFVLVATTLGMFLLKKGTVRRLAVPLAAMLIAAVVCLVVGVTKPLYVMFFALAAFALASNLSDVIKLLPSRWRLAAGPLTHTGFGVLLIGVLASSAFSSNQKVVLPRGESGTAFGRNVVYEGMESEISEPNNELILQMIDNGDSTELTPQLYYSERLDGIMRRPHIESYLLYDLYFAPEQVKESDTPSGLKLTRGERAEVGPWSMAFVDFVMGAHGGDMAGDMKISARLIASREGQVDTLMPSVELVTGEQGRSDYIDYPDWLIWETDSIPVNISRIMADEGAVVLDLPGLYEAEPESRLVLDVSKKMLIGLVWLGSVLIVLGGVFSFIRRRSEAPA